MSKYREADQQRVAAIFKALSNPHRLKIFLRLACCSVEGSSDNADGQICECVGVLGKDLGIASSTISHHLKELYRADLIKMKRRGQHIECWVDPQVLETLSEFFKLRAVV